MNKANGWFVVGGLIVMILVVGLSLLAFLGKDRVVEESPIAGSQGTARLERPGADPVERDLAPLATWNLDLANITQVATSGRWDIEISHGDSLSIMVAAPENPEFYVHLVQTGTRLEAQLQHTPGDSSWFGGAAHLTLVLPALEGLDMSGMGTAKIGSFEADHLTLTLSGATSADLFQLKAKLVDLNLSGATKIDWQDLEAQSLNISLSGASKIAGNGAATALGLSISGAGAADLSDVVCQDAKVDISGAGDVRIQATASVRGQISGLVNLKVHGAPPVVQVDHTGLASVNLE